MESMLPPAGPCGFIFLECEAFSLLVCNISNSMEVSHLFFGAYKRVNIIGFFFLYSFFIFFVVVRII